MREVSAFRRVRGGPGLLLVLGWLVAGAVRAEDLSTWLALSAETRRGWTLESSAERIHIAPDVPGAAPARTREVLVVLSVARSSLNWILEGMLPVFRERRFQGEFTLVALDKSREAHDRMLRLAESGRFDLILALGSDATRFLFNRFGNQPTPVVALCKDPELWLGFAGGTAQQARPDNMAFVSLSIPPQHQLMYIQELLGPLKVMTVVYDRLNQSSVEVEAESMRHLAARDGFQLLELAVEGKRAASTQLTEQVPQMARLMRRIDPEGQHSLFWVTTSSAVYDELERIDQLAGGLPVLGSVREVVREGGASAVMSIGVPFRSAGQRGALHVLDILDARVPPSRLPIGISVPDFALHLRRVHQLELKLPFQFLELASSIYGRDGQLLRWEGQGVPAPLSSAPPDAPP